MIHPIATDVEIFPNLFSITFVDITSYLNMFKDCVDSKGNPIAMTDVLSVKEIKDRLDKVKSKIFYISDTDDSQLLEMVAYINSLEETKTDRYDVYGFNNQGYDDLMIKCLLMYFNRFDTTKQLIKKLKEINDKIISLQNDKDAFYQDKEIEVIRNYKLPYTTVDLQKIFALNSASVNVDKDSGERVKFGKSLKQTSINLKWYELLDFTLPPIDVEEKNIYWNKQDAYRGMHIDELNQLITNDFNRYVLPKYVEPMLYYNKNDVFLVCEIVRQKPDEIRLRYSISQAFNINLLCCSRANIADKLFTKFYGERSGLHKNEFFNKRTERTKLSFKKIIFPHIHFKTKQLQSLLDEMKTLVITRTNKDSFSREVEFYGTTYTLATGGIHSVDPPRVCISDDKYIYLHHD